MAVFRTANRRTRQGTHDMIMRDTARFSSPGGATSAENQWRLREAGASATFRRRPSERTGKKGVSLRRIYREWRVNVALKRGIAHAGSP